MVSIQLARIDTVGASDSADRRLEGPCESRRAASRHSVRRYLTSEGTVQLKTGAYAFAVIAVAVSLTACSSGKPPHV